MSVESFRVTGDWRHVVDDGMVDFDDLPDEVKPTGHVRFTPIGPKVAIAGVPATAYTLATVKALVAGGRLTDLQGRDGVMLPGRIGDETVRWVAQTHLEYMGQEIDYPVLTFDLSGDAHLTALISNEVPGQPPLVIDPRIEGLVIEAQTTLAEMQEFAAGLGEASDTASASAREAAESANAAGQSASEALDYRNTALQAHESANESASEALGYRDQARTARDESVEAAGRSSSSANNSAQSTAAASGHAVTAGDRASEASQAAQTAEQIAQQVADALADATKYQEVLTAIGNLPDEWQQDIREAVAALVGQAPETLATLEGLAAALGDDPNFATTTAAEISKKADKTDPRFTDARTPTGHQHGLEDLPEVTQALADKSDKGHGHEFAQITDKPDAYPSTIPLVQGLQDALDAVGSGGSTDASQLTGALTDQVDVTDATVRTLDPDTLDPSSVSYAIVSAQSAAQQANDALSGKSDVGHSHTPAEVGLGNVDNTADADKPVSTDQRSAIDARPAMWLWDGQGSWTAPAAANDGDSVLNLDSGEIHSITEV